MSGRSRPDPGLGGSKSTPALKLRPRRWPTLTSTAREDVPGPRTLATRTLFLQRSGCKSGLSHMPRYKGEHHTAGKAERPLRRRLRSMVMIAAIHLLIYSDDAPKSDSIVSAGDVLGWQCTGRGARRLGMAHLQERPERDWRASDASDPSGSYVRQSSPSLDLFDVRRPFTDHRGLEEQRRCVHRSRREAELGARLRRRSCPAQTTSRSTNQRHPTAYNL